MRVEVVNPDPSQLDLVRRAEESGWTSEIDWDDPYEPDLALVTRLSPSTLSIETYCRKIYLALAFDIPILDCAWLIQSSIAGKWLPKARFRAKVEEYDDTLFQNIAIAVAIYGECGKDVTSICFALGANIVLGQCDLESITVKDQVLIYIVTSNIECSAWGICPGSWDVNMRCAYLGIPVHVRDLEWLFTCVRGMQVPGLEILVEN